MVVKDDIAGPENRDNLQPGDEWIDTSDLSKRINLSTNAILGRLRKNGLRSLQQRDARVVDAVQRIGTSRSGLVWRFLWREIPGSETRRVGYFSINKGEPDSVIDQRRKSIQDAAEKLGLDLYGVNFDDFRNNDRPVQLAHIIRDNQIKCIVTDREFSLGGRNSPFIRLLLEQSGLALVIAQGDGRDSSVVKLSYMDEICRLLINLALLGEEVDEIMGLARLKYKEMKVSHRDST